MKKILIWLLFLLFAVLLLRFWYTEQEKQREAEFSATVKPVIEELRYYDQLDLSFLEVQHEILDDEFKKNPERYVSYLKSSFADAASSYQQTNPWQLPLELDIPTLLSSLTLEQLVAQLFIFGVEGVELTPEDKQFLETSQPGWVILMWKNISPGLATYIDTLQATQVTLPLLVSIDQEWGQVKRIEEDLPWQPYLSNEAICDVYRTRAKLLHDVGITLNFGLVADVTTDTNSFIYPRVFQGDVSIKIAKATECTHLTLSTLKHFPWHGWTTQDSHQGAKTLNITKSSREEADLEPFISGIWAWADAVMMWHLTAAFLDPVLPATLSPTTHQFVRDLGFTGLVLTDDMWMISWDGDPYTQLEQALVAGNDLVLYVDGTNKQKLLDHAIWFIQAWWISEDDLRSRVRRILLKKQKIIALDDFVPLDLLED